MKYTNALKYPTEFKINPTNLDTAIFNNHNKLLGEENICIILSITVMLGLNLLSLNPSIYQLSPKNNQPFVPLTTFCGIGSTPKKSFWIKK